ncbi:MAG: hypothetical protein INQ03_22070 [Candidatus Heimdallarchaeota archaeon]|nr:hypothetical protein [Candidatus Heimdallarchaeota archaeon]
MSEYQKGINYFIQYQPFFTTCTICGTRFQSKRTRGFPTQTHALKQHHVDYHVAKCPFSCLRKHKEALELQKKREEEFSPGLRAIIQEDLDEVLRELKQQIR